MKTDEMYEKLADYLTEMSARSMAHDTILLILLRDFASRHADARKILTEHFEGSFGGADQSPLPDLTGDAANAYNDRIREHFVRLMSTIERSFSESKR